MLNTEIWRKIKITAKSVCQSLLLLLTSIRRSVAIANHDNRIVDVDNDDDDGDGDNDTVAVSIAIDVDVVAGIGVNKALESLCDKVKIAF